MPDEKTEPIKYWQIKASGIDDIGMFNSCSLPSMTLTANDFKVWDKQGKPNPLPVGVQATFGDVNLGRGVDKASRSGPGSRRWPRRAAARKRSWTSR